VVGWLVAELAGSLGLRFLLQIINFLIIYFLLFTVLLVVNKINNLAVEESRTKKIKNKQPSLLCSSK
jgi:large-conductance mechanosensitive channel